MIVARSNMSDQQFQIKILPFRITQFELQIFFLSPSHELLFIGEALRLGPVQKLYYV